MIHASKQAYIAVKNHRDAYGRFEAGDVVIVDDEALAKMLFREGSLDPSAVVDASVFTAPPAAHPPGDLTPAASASASPAAASDRMTRGPTGRRGRPRGRTTGAREATEQQTPTVDQATTAETDEG